MNQSESIPSDREEASRTVRRLITDLGAHGSENHMLPDGMHTPEWLNFGKLLDDRTSKFEIAKLLANVPAPIKTDVVIGAFAMGERATYEDVWWANAVHKVSSVPLVRLCKLISVSGEARPDFVDERDQRKALMARTATVIAGIVLHGGDAVTARNMLPEDCVVDLRAIWRRGTLLPENRDVFRNVDFLVEEELIDFPEASCPDHGDYEREDWST